jgi:hypothetical protein
MAALHASVSCQPCPCTCGPAPGHGTPTHPPARLPACLPALQDGIDATRKEEYLTEEEFIMVFGYDRDSYTGMPRWKQQQAKRSVNLF